MLSARTVAGGEVRQRGQQVGASSDGDDPDPFSALIRLMSMSDSSVTPEPRPLGYWLNAEHSAAISEPTVLRTMAYRWAHRRVQIIDLWGAALFAVVALLINFFTGVLFPTMILEIFAAALAVSAIAYTVYYRSRPLPSMKRPEPGVWIRTTRGGVLGALAFVAVVLLVVLFHQVGGGFNPDPVIVGIFVAYSFVMSVKLMWQGWHYEHARRLFRRHIEKDERVRTALEEMSTDPPRSAHAPGLFGPL